MLQRQAVQKYFYTGRYPFQKYGVKLNPAQLEGVPRQSLANLFLHYAMDEWMRRNYPDIEFERYADDAVFHCVTEEEAKALKTAIGARLAECRLELHPKKTKIVFCKSNQRRGSYPNEKFDFLGYTFRPRTARNRSGEVFVGFNPAVSNEAVKSIRRTMRTWKVHRRADMELQDLSRMYNPVIRGWVNYYSKYNKTALYPTFYHLNRTLIKWAMRKYKRFRIHQRRAASWLGEIARREPQLFAHWQMGARLATAGR